MKLLSKSCSEKINLFLPNVRRVLGVEQPFHADYGPGKSKVIVNSFPKSGTHLLGKLVQLVGLVELPIMILDNQYLDFKNKGDWHLWEPVIRSGIKIQNPTRKSEMCTKSLSRILDGQFTTAHLKYSNEIVRSLYKYKIKHLFIIRDLRDVICSVVDYRMSLTAHGYLPNWYYYLNALSSDEDRLLTVIEGKDRFLKSYSEHLEYGWGWINDPTTLKVRFEDLVGRSGGGNDKNQLATVRSVLEFIDVPIEDVKLRELASNLWGGKTRTMNRGLIGGWKMRFTSRVQDMFEEKYGHYMSSMGYKLTTIG